jgi:ABC-type glutathione transport system ATPase component
VGYYNEHSTSERQDIKHLERLCEAVCKVDWEALSIVKEPGHYHDDYFDEDEDDWETDTNQNFQTHNFTWVSWEGKTSKMMISDQQIEIEKLYGDIEKDSDVLDEENRISKLNDDLIKQEIFIANKLSKNYENFMAVKGISFGMKDSECFGLLGVNGAGKTSTFKMITGDELITQGEAYLNQISIKKDIKKVFYIFELLIIFEIIKIIIF